MHVTDAFPMSSKPESQVYVAVSPTEFLVNVAVPFTISSGSGHRAVERERYKNAYLHNVHSNINIV